ncbi:MAG: LPS export ABC transporter periplasmic protein LptC [Treponema sp.]|jgi:LPS export ABC transporter protein LptC|nr:LPS export ABC transporter periplasmic protein LptC [Treponema sp.]
MNLAIDCHKWERPLSKRIRKFHVLPAAFQIPHVLPVILMPLTIAFLSCSFDYGSAASGIEDIPDITMEDVEYVRVRNGDPKAKFTAEHAARYEDKQMMELKNLSFEQFENHGEEVNAEGKAGAASVELESGNIRMNGGVHITVESEDYIIETGSLEWHDRDRLLSSGTNEVNIRRTDGTNFSGHGFSADVRNRTWSFSAGVSGTYIHEDKEDEGNAAGTRDGTGQASVAADAGSAALGAGEAAPSVNPLSEALHPIDSSPQSEAEEGSAPIDAASEIQEKEEDAE